MAYKYCFFKEKLGQHRGLGATSQGYSHRDTMNGTLAMSSQHYLWGSLGLFD